MSASIVPDDPLLRVPGHELELHWRSSRHARRLLTLSLAGALIALLGRRPEFAGVAAPALLLLAAGRTQQRPARIIVRVGVSAGRAFEGEAVALDVRAEGHGDRYVQWMLYPGAEINPGDVTAVDGAQARFTLTAERWGRRRIGTMGVVVRDRWRLAEGHLSVILPVLDCYPGPADQRTTVMLRRLPNWPGEHPARTPGQGIEFFGVREYLPGDRQRSINWPASTRRGRLQVNTFAAERSQEVVLLADATSDVGEPGSSAVDLALRGAAAAARAYLEGRDRVGVITYQWDGVSWIAPRLGRRQLDRIIVSMMTSRPLASTAGWARAASSGRLPRAALPPGALIVVFSPLLDERFVESLRNIRERGFTMLVVDVLNTEPPVPRRMPRRGGLGGSSPQASTDQMARQIWQMEQQAIRFSLRELGVPVVHWDGVQSLDPPLAAYARRPLAARR
jgi:uncharacterized protein (DUF58 family)